MFYVIGGASRSGKSTLAGKLKRQEGISSFSTDYLMGAFHHGLPELGIRYETDRMEKCLRIWPFIKALIAVTEMNETGYVLEGDLLLPRLVASLQKEYPEKIATCFIGYPDACPQQRLGMIRANPDKVNPWICRESDEYILGHIRREIEFSRMIREDCQRHGMKFFDTSLHFNSVVDDALLYLRKPLNLPSSITPAFGMH